MRISACRGHGPDRRDQRSHPGAEILGSPSGYEVAVDDRLRIDPFGTGIHHVVTDRPDTGRPPPPQRSRLRSAPNRHGR